MRKLFRSIAVFAVLSFLSLAPVSLAAAYDPLDTVDCTRGSGSAVCTNRTGADPLTGTDGVIIQATNILAWIGGVAAVIFMVVGGIKYITAAGAPADVQKAKETIIYAFVGLIAIVLARQVITYVLSRV
jgi:hypothetical protein